MGKKSKRVGEGNIYVRGQFERLKWEETETTV